MSPLTPPAALATSPTTLPGSDSAGNDLYCKNVFSVQPYSEQMSGDERSSKRWERGREKKGFLDKLLHDSTYK